MFSVEGETKVGKKRGQKCGGGGGGIGKTERTSGRGTQLVRKELCSHRRESSLEHAQHLPHAMTVTWSFFERFK